MRALPRIDAPASDPRVWIVGALLWLSVGFFYVAALVLRIDMGRF